MKLVLSQEQQDLRGSVRSFLASVSPMSGVREAMESADGYDRSVYDRLNGELGLAGLIVPEEYGGAGAGHADLAVALEETGAALLPGPFLATVFATIALLPERDKELLTAVAGGGLTATVVSGPSAGPDGVVSGIAPQVINGLDAEVLLVRDGRHGLVAVDADAGGVTREALGTLDPTRRQARITFDRASGRVIAGSAAGEARSRDLIAVALAAEQLGVLRASLDAILAYSRIRVAFGRYIGSYQAVKHKLADMHCKLEQAESIVRHAAWAADESPGELPEAAALAQIYLGRACFEVARDHLLLFGGIGYTWEHDAHLYYKRAKADEVLLGPPRAARARLADLLEL
ncbi:acyl-CoA dehydrogenase family protein [Streptosporangium sp. KLBMP 9127]|nr:acyl-CoA/acyl-ACP dehydrogenase [Streptosporangium sp. KLBMP 9127]